MMYRRLTTWITCLSRIQLKPLTKWAAITRSER
jgi:hypothetical protein